MFAIPETITFCLQLCSSSDSLRAFLSHGSPESAGKATPTVRVFLSRQTQVTVEGQTLSKEVLLGEGKMRPRMPTSEFLSYPALLDNTITSLDWEGKVRCKDDVVIGGFSVGANELVVKVCVTARGYSSITYVGSMQDFITLRLVSSSTNNSPIFEHEHAHPIRLVTDPYVETNIRE